MPAIIAFVRGINVGGNNPLPMPELIKACEAAGCRDVKTYIQSGNVAFRASGKVTLASAASLATQIEDAIEKGAGFRPSVILRTLAENRSALSANPFDADPAKVLIMFLASKPAPAAARALAEFESHPEELRPMGREIYIHFPNGIGRSKLSMAKIEKTAGTPGTCRNINTVRKMIELGESFAEDE